MTRVSLIVINYRSAALAAGAIETARRASSDPIQVVAVDNSEDEREAAALRPLADVVIAAPRNLGYAGGINAGRRASDGDVLLVSNPDVRFGQSSIDRLVAANAAVAGPALFWDEEHRWFLPPAELHTRGEVVDRVLATRSNRWARRRARRRFLSRVAFWSLRSSTPVRALSGAVMAIRTSAFDRAGGFDERFPLYFEENDFVRRVNGEIRYVPAAVCRHLYNQSAGASPEATGLYARSELSYLRKWGGDLVKGLERDLPAEDVRTAPSADSESEFVTEASPLATFETAAGCFGSIDAGVSDDIWSSYRGDVLYLRIVEKHTGRVVKSWAKARIGS